MNRTIEIRCRDLGVDHDSFVSGSSLDELVECAQQMLREEGVTPFTPESVQLLRDTVRSALLQASRPARYRSSDISKVIAAFAAPTPTVRSSSWQVTA